MPLFLEQISQLHPQGSAQPAADRAAMLKAVNSMAPTLKQNMDRWAFVWFTKKKRDQGWCKKLCAVTRMAAQLTLRLITRTRPPSRPHLRLQDRHGHSSFVGTVFTEDVLLAKGSAATTHTHAEHIEQGHPPTSNKNPGSHVVFRGQLQARVSQGMVAF